MREVCEADMTVVAFFMHVIARFVFCCSIAWFWRMLQSIENRFAAVNLNQLWIGCMSVRVTGYWVVVAVGNAGMGLRSKPIGRISVVWGGWRIAPLMWDMAWDSGEVGVLWESVEGGKFSIWGAKQWWCERLWGLSSGLRCGPLLTYHKWMCQWREVGWSTPSRLGKWSVVACRHFWIQPFKKKRIGWLPVVLWEEFKKL